MKIYIFGNGNISFSDFINLYEKPLSKYFDNEEVEFLICDFRGVDTLMMELLKDKKCKVSIYHIGTNPRYLPDKFKTRVSSWRIKGGFENDEQRDLEALKTCTHFMATDFNSDNKRKSGTQKNIDLCVKLGKIKIDNEIVIE